MKRPQASDIRVFSTCPPSKGRSASEYRAQVVQAARWSEEGGCEGMLVYTDNGLVDPWLVAQLILQNTAALAPLVAVQPVYLHPYTAAKMVATLAFLHQRRVDLNMLAGGFKTDLEALGDATPHDDRYRRTVEYSLIVQGLLAGDEPVTFDGAYYAVHNLRLSPPVPPELRPDLMISGSSEAGVAAARAIGAIAIRYPKPPGEDDAPASVARSGVRVGIIARESAEDAWEVAHQRFPDDRRGQLTHQLAMKTSDSQWHQQLSARAPEATAGASPYWLGPFQNYHTFCPYLVGTHERIARELVAYARQGHTTFILDVPATREELRHIGTVFALAREALA